VLQLDYKVVLNAFADAMIVAAPDGRIIYANPAVERVLGWEPAEIIGQPLTVIVPAPDRRNFVREATSSSSTIIGRAVRRALLHRDGSEIEVELSLSTVFVGSRPVWIAGVRDLRDRLELEANAQLYREAQEAVRARDEFLSVASHELKTPLCALALSLQTLVMRANSAPSEAPSLQELSSKAESANQVVQRILRLMDEMLEVSRITGGRISLDLEELELAGIIEELLQRSRDELQRAGCTLQFHADDRLLGNWDRLRIEQIVSNLLSNAMKYGRGRPIEVGLTGTPNAASLTVRDWGIGIPVEEQARIFERFERAVTARIYTGFGLGLWIVRQIVDALGGSIHVQSQPGRGALFTVSIPRDPISAVQSQFQSPVRTGTS
jgi:PAS domain S-box-containing protein